VFLILDEWIFYDLQNKNGEDRQEESFRFLGKIYEKCDKIVWIKESKFENKYWNFSKIAQWNTELSKKFKFLEGYFRYNLSKIKFVELSNINHLREEIKKVLEKIKNDDHYIVLSYFILKEKTQECIIVTTDGKLKNTLEEEGINIKLRDEFIKEYLQNELRYH
jgi:hypothetical protein